MAPSVVTQETASSCRFAGSSQLVLGRCLCPAGPEEGQVALSWPCPYFPNPCCDLSSIQVLMTLCTSCAAGPGGRAGQQGPHLFLSQAHFCGADSRLTENVSGLSCNISKHVTYLDVESLSGETAVLRLDHKAGWRLTWSFDWPFSPSQEAACLVCAWIRQHSYLTALPLCP